MNDNWEEMIAIMESAFSENEGTGDPNQFVDLINSYYFSRCMNEIKDMDIQSGQNSQEVGMLSMYADDWYNTLLIGEKLFANEISLEDAYEEILGLDTGARDVAFDLAVRAGYPHP